MVAYTCNPSTWEAEAGGAQIQGQPWLQNEALLQKQKKNEVLEMAGGDGCDSVHVLSATLHFKRG
jgi:hypothetical protein